MKLYLEPITMTMQHGMPYCLEWRGQVYMVITLLDRWMAEGRWWHRPYKRLYLLLETDRGVLEVYRESDDTASWTVGWKLSRIND